MSTAPETISTTDLLAQLDKAFAESKGKAKTLSQAQAEQASAVTEATAAYEDAIAKAQAVFDGASAKAQKALDAVKTSHQASVDSAQAAAETSRQVLSKLGEAVNERLGTLTGQSRGWSTAR